MDDINRRLAVLEELVGLANAKGAAAAASQARAQAQTAWFIDPVAGSDTASGLTAETALKTYAELALRWGTTQPTFSAVVTITFLNNNVVSDPLVLEPILIGNGGFLVQGTLQPIGTATLGTWTAKNKAAGTTNEINIPGMTWVPGTIVHDTTANASFAIDADLGGGTARITEPLELPIAFNPTQVALANGNALEFFEPTILYINKIGLKAGLSIGELPSSTVRTLLNISLNGNLRAFIGSSMYIIECTCQNNCIVQTLHEDAAFGPVFIGTRFGTFSGFGQFQGFGIFWGGAFNGEGNTFEDVSQFDYDVLVNGDSHASGGVVTIGSAYFAAWFANDLPEQTFTNFVLQAGNSGFVTLWGPTGISVDEGCQFVIRGVNAPRPPVTAANSLLIIGAITMDTATTAFPWVSGSHAYGAAVTITPANIDSNGSLSNPATGSRIFINAIE